MVIMPAIMEAGIILMSVIRLLMLGGEQNNWSFQDGWYLGTVLRYLCRNGNKKGNSKEQDLQKCINYLQMYLDKLKSKREQTEPLDYTE
ncbi:MAG: DUF3310 domain-containing protein [Eubacterium ventriosum]